MVRSIIMSLIVLVLVVYVALYIFLSVPSVQQKVKTVACDELSQLLGGRLDMDRLYLRPFSEIRLTDVSLASPQGLKCAEIEEVAAGIDLWTLVSKRKIVLNYVEVIGLDAGIEQKEKGDPLNIQFMIDALSPKDRTKPPTRFDIRFRNVVIRRSKASFSRPWLTDADGKPHRMSRISLSGLRMDLSIPKLKNDDFRFDVRGMRCSLDSLLDLRDLSARIDFRKTPKSVPDTLTVKNLRISLPSSLLSFSDVKMPLGKDPDIAGSVSGHVTPADFKILVPALSAFDSPWDIDADVAYSGSLADLNEFTLVSETLNSEISLAAHVANIEDPRNIDAELRFLEGRLSGELISKVCSSIPGVRGKAREILNGLGSISFDLSGSLADASSASIEGEVTTEAGSIALDATATAMNTRRPHIVASLEGTDVRIGKFFASDLIGDASFSLEADLRGMDRNAEGSVDLLADYVTIGGKRITGVDLSAVKEAKSLGVSISNSDPDFNVDAFVEATLDGVSSTFESYLAVNHICPASFGVQGMLTDCTYSGTLHASGKGNNADNMVGSVAVAGLNIAKPDKSILHLDNLTLSVDDLSSGISDSPEDARRRLSLRCDWVDADVSGTVRPQVIVPEFRDMLAEIFPSLFPSPEQADAEREKDLAFNDFNFKVTLKGGDEPYEFFNVPLRPLSDIPVEGFVNTRVGKAAVSLKTPHIQQGANKLIRDTNFSLYLDSFEGLVKMSAGTIYPTNKGDVQLALDVEGMRDVLKSVLQLNPTLESSLKGNVAMDVSFSKEADFFNPAGDLAVKVDIIPSAVSLGNTKWTVSNGSIDYAGKRVAVKNFLLQHANQYVKIDGVASESPHDKLKVKLNDIDLDYIFGLLNINYVKFGGMASGEVTGSQLLTKTPVAHTNYLRVRNLSYNGAVLGDGDIASDYEADSQKVGIYAVVRDPLTRERRADIEGGIWVTRDSLSFDFDANKVNIQFMKPFVSAFCSDLRGFGSGKCKLYGSFSDIDLVGRLMADTVSMKLDFTNTWYHAGGDSVFMKKGLIDIPPITLYDDEGHTAELSGWLRHRYFHEPEFDFRLRNARSILCYDTNEKLNPLWYGTIYGSGSGQISGRPGLVKIDMNMRTDNNSRFFYVIGEAEDVDGMSFLTFTDRRKEEKIKAEAVDTMPPYLRKFMKMKSDMEEGSSNVMLSIRGSVTPDALVTLVMDPKGGDKITARGEGALQMDYNMASNDLRMFGTYVLDEGNYNFTLQDIIIKNFNIREGSQIKFDGDPMNANLDITATYRVNTNLTDLDKSFSSDKELNRTNVPVDALLFVKGPMTQPDITFDIELPSLTSDVERKVKSIVSTNDMMSRQIIYLLALNRFYTPEYTGATSQSGAEWSSMASSTISSQLSNILSQMTDKLSVAPSFRSDKGDFTDMEFDLALSSRLLNNRLLINGNFGYRDRSTSNTQFIGDFDIEYLLNKYGNLRLKAYNHFNDQNYYLRSALTTQGVGVVFRHDFDRLWRRKEKEKSTKNDENPDGEDSSKEEKTDSIQTSSGDKALYDKNP